jgi:hypothetical protein
METAITSRLPYDMPPELAFTDTDSAGTTTVWRLLGTPRRNPQPGIIKAIAYGIFKATWWHITWASPDITPESAGGEQIETTQQRIAWASPDIIPESADSEQIFDAIQSLYLSNNRTRDRQIAIRIIALYRDALAEDERILSASLRQFADFFLAHPDLSLPRITLTPDGTLRARWIQGTGSFTAIEFTGKLLAKLVAEIPREGGQTAQYFGVERVDKILSSARAIGASFV